MQLSQVTYTSTIVLGGTTATGMKCQGHSLEEIAYILKHKNLESLKHYLDAPILKDKENYAESLFKYTNDETEKKKKETTTKSKPNATVSIPPKDTDKNPIGLKIAV